MTWVIAGVFVAIAVGVAVAYIRGEKVGEVRGTMNDLDVAAVKRMRIVVSRRAGADGAAPGVDVKLLCFGMVRVIPLQAEEAMQLADLLEAAAAKAKA